MSRESVKVRLIRELERQGFDAPNQAMSAYYYKQARALRSRGSGPLPWWAKQFAREWGIR